VLLLKKARKFFVWTFWGLGEVGKKKEKRKTRKKKKKKKKTCLKKNISNCRKKKEDDDDGDDERVKKEMIAGSSFPRNSAGANANGEDGRTKKEHAPHSGACSTWVDDEIEAMPEELRNVMPRPSCCEKDEAEQREASRLIKMLKSMDRVQLKADAKAQFIVNSGDDAQQFLQQQGQQQQTNADNEEDEDEDSDFGNTDDEDEENDPYLRELKAARIREMRLNAMKAEQLQKQAEYVNARERELGDIVKKNARVLCHFTLYGVDECARIDEVFDNLAKGFPKTKFVRILPELGSKSPTLQMCNISQPPAIVYFKNRRLSSWTNGFDQFGGRNGFSEESVTKFIAGIGALPGHPDAPRRNAGAKESREEDEYAYFDSDEDGEHSDDNDGEVFGEPCPDCGRTYPHKHIRALRPGGERVEEESDENTDSE